MIVTTESNYYENIKYQEFLLSSRRKNIYPPEKILDKIDFKGVRNLVDFGMGLGFFIPFFKKKLKDTHIWGVECQQDLIDLVLKKKVEEEIENLTCVYMEKNEHPLLPDWIPIPEMVFASLSISTFPDPGLAMDGLMRSMKKDGRLVVVDWSKVDFPEGPAIKDRVSLDKMLFLADYYHLKVKNQFHVTEHVYAFEVVAGEEFKYGLNKLKKED